MMIFEKFEIVENYPALYFGEIEALVISDLHLGLESLMTDSGLYMPKFQLSEMKEEMKDISQKKDFEKIIVCGDIKHEFSETSYQEKKEVEEFIEFSQTLAEDIYFVKGNHDNYLIYSVKRYPQVRLEDSFVFDGVNFIHGHEKIEDLTRLDTEYLIMGHEHPALSLTDEVGAKEKVRCFLYGEMRNGMRLIVLPAFSRLAQGSQMNQLREEDLLSPVLKDMIEVGEMKAVGVDKEAGLFEFPKLKKIRSLG
ncbi:MAG: metallophosphoesterase [Candidatus Thermoplasmatota archaeon]|nr:metallophosphoesterase [Candidatus Thermoplasmatota archaeon]MBS3789833.1 metallophosphoesterase [Candidatus Thermoplasmatota archaeon]